MRLASELSHFFYPHGDLRPRVLLGMIRSRRFIRMRWIIALALLALYGLERWRQPDFQRPPEVAYCAIFLMLINLAWGRIGRTWGDARESEAEDKCLRIRVLWFVNAQMCVDLLVLTVLVRYSGGIENPMTIFYLFHMLIAALLLRPLNALLQGCWALLLFGIVASGEYFGWLRPHYPFLPYAAGAPHQDWEYVLVVTATLAVGIFGTLYFTLRISFGLDEQEQRLRTAMNEAHLSRQALQDLQARRARFMRTAAHQLKSPLAGAQTLAGLVRDGIIAPQEAPTVCGRIVQRCREGITQVGELLTLARIQQADVRTLFGASCDVGEVVKDLVARQTPVAVEKTIVIECDVCAASDLRLSVDAVALRDCIGNLLENAIKYTAAGGRVSVRVRRGRLLELIRGLKETTWRSSRGNDEEYIVVSVSDSGMGIAPEALAAMRDGITGTIFDAFRRGDQALEAQIPGSGLGLAIVLEIMEQLRGYIFVESQLHHGSTFTVAFPLQMNASDKVAEPTGATTIAVLGADSSGG